MEKENIICQGVVCLPYEVYKLKAPVGCLTLKDLLYDTFLSVFKSSKHDHFRLATFSKFIWSQTYLNDHSSPFREYSDMILFPCFSFLNISDFSSHFSILSSSYFLFFTLLPLPFPLLPPCSFLCRMLKIAYSIQNSSQKYCICQKTPWNIVTFSVESNLHWDKKMSSYQDVECFPCGSVDNT